MKHRVSIFFIVFVLVSINNSCTVSWTKAVKYGEIKQDDFIETVEFEISNNLIFVPVQINGKSYRFLFDTGAIFSISKELQEAYNFKKVSKGYLVDSDKNREKVPYVRVDDLEIAKITFENQTAFVGDFKANPILECLEIDGIIGSNLMRHCNWTIDQKNKKLSFGTSIHEDFIKNSYQVPFKTNNQFDILLNLGIGPATVKNIKLDYGSNGPLTLPKNSFHTLKENKIIEKTITEKGIKNSGIFGKAVNISREITFIDSLKINDSYIENVWIKTGSSGLLGNKILSRFIVTIDYKNQILYFQKLDSVISNNWSYGVKLGYNAEKGIIVNSVIENSKASQNGIMANMKVTKVDSLNFELNHDFCDYVSFMNNPPENLYIELIDSTGQKVDFRLIKTDIKQVYFN